MPVAIRWAPLPILGLILASPVNAATIISVEGPITGLASFIGGSSNQVLDTSWSTTQSYTNVSIAASIGSLDSSFATGTAFLTSQIGPQTTTADLITSYAFTAPVVASYGTQIQNTTLFTGLTLSPGTYNLVLSGPPSTGNPLYWNDDGATAPGVTYKYDTGVTGGNGVFFSLQGSNNTSYPPASIFNFSNVDSLFFTVNGDPVTVPEPSAMSGILLLGAIGLAGLGMKTLRGETPNCSGS